MADKENKVPFGLKKTRKGGGCGSSSDTTIIEKEIEEGPEGWQ
ncbi:MAG: hypothetical protein R6U61_01410 [Thermoplasmata archaeon]